MKALQTQDSGSAIVERLKKVYRLEKDAHLAKALGMDRGEISNWKARNQKPYAKCLQIAQEKGVFLEWILTGEGQMYKSQVQEARGAFEVPALAVSQARVSNLLAMLASLPAGEQERVMGELQARAEDAQQLAELKAAVESIRQCKGGRAA